ncbi:hypothetical protein [Mycobacterium deserti]|uniref:Secreted protein n=1 Tax=Mycobacterium deserti TaxID=2978347 RepID=A0ABT2MEA8_9MYCO|nr:hypothetical protein [Mycobacterium deserti]MCT7660588.1 hypothetical protein [Mycobacterium deserti]
MKSFKIMTAAVLMVAAAIVAPPPAQAMMKLGNYDLLTNRYDRPASASWFWYVRNCWPDKQPDCVHVAARPRRAFYRYYEGSAQLVNGRYTMTVDVVDGLICPDNRRLPTRETYSWDEVSLAGTIESHYSVGCFNGPPGMQFWTFALVRL